MALLAVTIMISFCIPVALSYERTDDLALGYPSWSNSNAGETWVASKAFDNDDATYWCSDGTSNINWLGVDLVIPFKIDTMIVYWQSVTADLPFAVERSSDNVTWVTVANFTKQVNMTLRLGSTAQFWRLYITGTDWAGIYRWSLFGAVELSTTQLDVNWMAFIVLIVFAVLNIFLILVPRVYVLNFVVAALTLAFAAATVNDATLPIQPYFSLIVALLSVLGILRAAQLLRNG